MRIHLVVSPDGRPAIGGDDEAKRALLRLSGSQATAAYILANALLWYLGADIAKDAAHRGARGYDGDAYACASRCLA